MHCLNGKNLFPEISPLRWWYKICLIWNLSCCNTGEKNETKQEVDIKYPLLRAFSCQVVLVVKNPPAKQETWVLFLGQEDLLERGMASHSSILPRKPHGQRSLPGYSSWGCKESDRTSQLSIYTRPHRESEVWRSGSVLPLPWLLLLGSLDRQTCLFAREVGLCSLFLGRPVG